MENQERGNLLAKRVGEYHAKQGMVVQHEYSIEVGFNSNQKKKHRFDYGNENLIVECKYYDWTESRNNPSGKISTLDEAMMLLYSASKQYRKMLFIVMTDKKEKKPETLAEYYIRLHKSFIPDEEEIWEFDDIKFLANRIFN